MMDKKTDNFEEEIKNYPPGEHNDQVNARTPPRSVVNPVIFNVFFNVATILFSTILFVMIIVGAPILMGYIALTLIDYMEYALGIPTATWLTLWLIGLPILAAFLIGLVGIVGLGQGFFQSIKNAIFRMGYRK